ncbi:hypothetical protein ACFYO0_25430 [Streptomyces sp. NPDC006365]
MNSAADQPSWGGDVSLGFYLDRAWPEALAGRVLLALLLGSGWTGKAS